MAKTMRNLSPAPHKVFKKAYIESVQAKVNVGCTLHELCAEDKSKVAKLLRQVVELEKELTTTRAQSKQEKHNFQEKVQHLRQRNADILRESNTLKAKLTHAFALLRAYQHKVRHMSTAAATGSDLHSSSALCFQRPQQLYCQHCGHTALVRSSNTAGRLEMNDSVTPSHLEPSIVLSADDGLQPSASIGSHDHLESGRIQGADGGHTAHQLASAQAANTIPFRQKPLAELASEMLARQPDSAASQGTAQKAANCERCKILRFDPSLGTDGAFYFTASQSLDMQPPASQCELDQMAATSSSSCPQPADAMVQQQQQQHQHSGSRPGSPSRHMRLPEPASLQAATQSGRHEDGVHPYVAPGEKARQSSSDQAAHAQSRAGITEVGDAQVQPMQADDAKTVGEQQVAVQAQPQFPIQGGGEAGVLLRAAAAAAAGCSHELVVAAAGRACVEEELNSRPISHRDASVQPAPAIASACFPTYATSCSSGEGLLHNNHGSGSTRNPSQAEGQAGDGGAMTLKLHEPHPDPGAGRVDGDLQSLGFDSSLMDLVTEVEQMVACKQANIASADRQPAHDRRLDSRVALLHKHPSAQGPGEEEDFEENDVISLISDQEYSMH